MPTKHSQKLVYAGVLSLLLLTAGLWLLTEYGLDQWSPAAITQPLRRSSSNPRYFTDGTGKAVYLTGAHTWHALQDSGPAGGSLKIFDYHAYLNFLTNHRHNFMKMWMFEGSESGGFYYEPQPWSRTSSGKYDLNQFNQAYFDRLRSRIIAARDRGIYVDVMLFQGWSIYDHGYGNPWPAHPFNGANNVNGIDGDANGDGSGEEVHSLQVPAVTNVQKAYIRKVIDTVNDLDNVLYEITNESLLSSKDWQYHMVNLIKSYEASKPKRHPVGMTAFADGPPGSMAALLTGPADWVSPQNEGGCEYQDDPTSAEISKVILVDTDHLFGARGSRSWVWRNFTRGLNPILMDYTANHWDDPERNGARRAMGHTWTYAHRMNLAAMTPRGDLASTGYALANPGSEYLVYNPDGGSFSVALQSATYQVEWFNPLSGQTSSGGTVGGGSRSFSPPFSGETVLYLKGPGAGASPTPTATRAPTP